MSGLRAISAGSLRRAGSNAASYGPNDARSLSASPKGSAWKAMAGSSNAPGCAQNRDE